MHMSCIIGHLTGVKLAYQCNASSQASSSQPLIRRHPPWGLSKALGKKNLHIFRAKNYFKI